MTILDSNGKRPRHTIDKVRAILKAENYTLLTEKYLNNTQKLEYICPLGHRRSISIKMFLKGQRCGKCTGREKLTLEDVREKFEAENYKLLAEEYKNSLQKLSFICPNGHQHSIRYADFNTGYRCAKCAGLAKPTIEEVRAKFESENFVLISTEYVNCLKHLEYICPRNHRGSISFSHFTSGHRCNQCAVEARRGKGCHRWNPLLTDEQRISTRKIPDYATWRRLVFIKDDYKCVACESKECLEAHHLDSFCNYPDLRLEPLNGVTLCNKHHKAFHQSYGFIDNTKAQFEQFLLDGFGKYLTPISEDYLCTIAKAKDKPRIPKETKLPFQTNLTEKRFGKWTVIKYAGKNKWKQNLWECKCDCGTVKNVPGYMLTSGQSASCRCKRNLPSIFDMFSNDF